MVLWCGPFDEEMAQASSAVSPGHSKIYLHLLEFIRCVVCCGIVFFICLLLVVLIYTHTHTHIYMCVCACVYMYTYVCMHI